MTLVIYGDLKFRQKGFIVQSQGCMLQPLVLSCLLRGTLLAVGATYTLYPARKIWQNYNLTKNDFAKTIFNPFENSFLVPEPVSRFHFRFDFVSVSAWLGIPDDWWLNSMPGIQNLCLATTSLKHIDASFEHWREKPLSDTVKSSRRSIRETDWSWSSLVEGYDCCIGPSCKLLCFWQTKKIMQHIFMFDCWVNPVVHLLLLKSTMHWDIVTNNT